jgi:hypothetical protein
MKRSSLVLWGLVGVLVAIAVVVSCASSGGDGECDPTGCTSDCIAVGHTSGHCSAGACMCTDFDADADADTPHPDDGPGPDDAIHDDTAPDVDVDAPHDDAAPEDRVGDDARPDDIRRDDVPIPTDDGTTPPPPDSTTPDAKSGCDPLVCFMSCGGTCSVGGTCVCEPR